MWEWDTGDHHLSSLSKPRYAGQIFLSHPHDRFLYFCIVHYGLLETDVQRKFWDVQHGYTQVIATL